MVNTKKRIKEYWDGVLMKKMPPTAQFEKVSDELKEHYDFLVMMWKDFLLPIVVFYFIMGIVLDKHILGPLFLSFLVFIYSNLLPDSDIFIQFPKEKERESLWYEQYFLLFFVPIYFYYIIKNRANPIFSKVMRPFHNVKTIFIWGAFLLFVGYLFWPDSLLNQIMFSLFGMVGFAFHLAVDGIIKFYRIRIK